MMQNLTNRIAHQKAKNILDKGDPLKRFIVDGSIEFDAGSRWENQVTIEDCVLENFNCLMVYFRKPVSFKNCYFKNAAFNFSYFYGGLTIENCKFDKYLDFEAGGHNDPGNLYLIKNSEFLGFVNFNDCWFTGDVSLLDNVFHSGTNIASDEQYITLDGNLTIENNIGRTNIDDDCRVRE